MALTIAVLAPVAFLMGMPFPLGLARVARIDPALVVPPMAAVERPPRANWFVCFVFLVTRPFPPRSQRR